MKIIGFNTLIFSCSILFAGSALAHDPSKHKNKAEKPKCETMKEMDHAKMDANDPVMMAMMKKCEGQAHHQDESSSDASLEENAHQEKKSHHEDKPGKEAGHH